MNRFAIPILGLLLAAAPASAAPATTAEQDALRELVTSYERAIRSGEVSKSGIRARLAKGFSAALPSGQLVAGYTDLNKAENALRTMVGRGTRYQTVEVTVDPAIEVSGELAALSGRTFNQASAQAGKNLTFTTHWSAVARKEEGAWRLLRHQAVMDPSTNPWQVAETGGPGWTWVLAAGALGGLTGAVLGFAASRFLGSRPATVARPGTTGPSEPASPAPASSRPRAWDKESPTPANERTTEVSTVEGPRRDGPVVTTTDASSASAGGKPRSWQTASPSPSRAHEPEPAPPVSEAPAAPEAPRPGKKRAWEA